MSPACLATHPSNRATGRHNGQLPPCLVRLSPWHNPSHLHHNIGLRRVCEPKKRYNECRTTALPDCAYLLVCMRLVRSQLRGWLAVRRPALKPQTLATTRFVPGQIPTRFGLPTTGPEYSPVTDGRSGLLRGNTTTNKYSCILILLTCTSR
jgi:hypothetical protein